VVAHSAGGIFLPLLAASTRPVRHIVFLAAVVPAIGKSIVDQIKEDADMVAPDWRGVDPTTDDDAAIKFLFHDCSVEVAAWALTTRRLMLARRAMTEICPVKEWPGVAVSSIVCKEDRTMTPGWSRRTARERLGIEPIEIDGGHCPHVSRPAELADVLARIAG